MPPKIIDPKRRIGLALRVRRLYFTPYWQRFRKAFQVTLHFILEKGRR